MTPNPNERVADSAAPDIVLCRTSALPADQFHCAFTNTLTDDEAAAVYERDQAPGPDRVLFQGALANFNPTAATKVDLHNDDRAPLLLIAGGKDHISPASVTNANFDLYHSKAVTELKEFPDRSHFTIGEPGWESVADYALDRAVTHAAPRGEAPRVQPSGGATLAEARPDAD